MLKCFDLTGKIAVVTGGNRGLGRSMAEGLAESGASLFLIATRPTALEQACNEIHNKYGVECAYAAADITDEHQVQEAVAKCMARYGRIDILINNAGTDRVAEHPEDADMEKWRRVIEININGAFIVAKHVGRTMIGSGKGGRIVNLSSICGYTINPMTCAGSYDISKQGIVGLTRALAVEWAKHNIQVNAIAPGYFMTEPNRQACDEIPGLEESCSRAIPLGRWGDPDELKGLAVFLSSDAASYLEGCIITCDGGVTIT